MFGSIGMTELLVILVVALLVIGPKRLPELAKSIGRALGEFKRATSDLTSAINIDEDDFDIEPSETPASEETPGPEEKEEEKNQREAQALQTGGPPAGSETAAESGPAAENAPAEAPSAPATPPATPEEGAPAKPREQGSQAT